MQRTGTRRLELRTLTEPLVATSLGFIAIREAFALSARYRGTPRLPRGFGADTYLYAVGGLLMALGIIALLIVLVRFARGTSAAAADHVSGEVVHREGFSVFHPLVRVAAMVVLLTLMVRFMSEFGLLVVVAPFFLLAGKMMGFDSWIRAAIFSALATGGLYVIFVEFLSMRLP